MTAKYVIDVTPDQKASPGAVMVMEHVDDREAWEEGPFSVRSPITEYTFRFDGKEYKPEDFVAKVRRGLKLVAAQDAGPGNVPGWKFVVGGREAR